MDDITVILYCYYHADTKKEIQEECETDDSSESEDEDEDIADFKKKFLDENCKIRPEVWKKLNR